MFFSVIIQSYLGEYKNAASQRESKLIRAINSVNNQTYKNHEVIVIADGCEETFQIVTEEYKKQQNIDCILIQKQPMWSGNARNYAKQNAKGNYCTYLDGDDYWGENHLKKIHDGIVKENYPDWVWYNDLVMDKAAIPHERKCMITQKYQSGTANITHKTNLDVKWGDGYGIDDFSLVQQLLRKHPNYKNIQTPEYYVCHIPVYKIDV